MSLDFSRPHQHIDVGHSQLAYYRFGRGPDVVLIHGWPLTAATYRHLVARLAERYTCHLFDLPTTGATEITAATPIGIPQHAATVRAAIDRLGLSRYALVGHDSGGFIARIVAANDPRAVALVLSNTEIPGHTPPMLTLLALVAKLGLGPLVFGRMLRSSWLRRSMLGFGGCFTDAAYVDGEFKTVQLDPLLQPGKLAGQLRLFDTLSHDLMATLDGIHAQIKVPVALVWGTDDPWFPLAKAKRMMPSFAGPTTLTEIAAGKLFVHEDRADEVAAAAIAHLETYFAASPNANANASSSTSSPVAPSTSSRSPVATPR